MRVFALRKTKTPVLLFTSTRSLIGKVLGAELRVKYQRNSVSIFFLRRRKFC